MSIITLVKTAERKLVSVTFSLADAQAREAFVEKCFQYGVDEKSLYVTDFGQFVIVDNLSQSLAELLSKEFGVKDVFEDAPLHPFNKSAAM
jgi:hypothetical protein